MPGFVNGTPVPLVGETGWSDELSAWLTAQGKLGVNVREQPYNAVGDGSADDTAAIQAAIDVAIGGAGVPGLTIFLPAGAYKITSQLNVYRKSIRFVGAGVGNPANFASGPGQGTTLIWAGAAAGNMVNVRDCKWIAFSDIYFQGNTTNVPASLIYFESAGGSVGTNEQMFIDRCHFGSLAWSNPGTSGGTSATVGVRFGGSNANNDQFHIRDCVFERCATGLKIEQTQSVWGVVTNVLFNLCSTAGLDTVASVTLFKPTFNGCAIDYLIGSTARVYSFAHECEGSVQIANFSNVGFLAMYGGHILNHSGMTTRMFEHALACNGGGLALYGMKYNLAGVATKTIYMRGAGGGSDPGVLTMSGCVGWDIGALDIQHSSGTAPLLIDASGVGSGSGYFELHKALVGAETLSTSRSVAYEHPVVATASLPAASGLMDGEMIIEDNGTGDRNLILYAGGQRFRIDGGANV